MTRASCFCFPVLVIPPSPLASATHAISSGLLNTAAVTLHRVPGCLGDKQPSCHPGQELPCTLTGTPLLWLTWSARHHGGDGGGPEASLPRAQPQSCPPPPWHACGNHFLIPLQTEQSKINSPTEKLPEALPTGSLEMTQPTASSLGL